MSHFHLDPAKERNPQAFLTDCEAFYVPPWTTSIKPAPNTFPTDGEGNYLTPGWYWQIRYAGCLPDGDTYGPFTSEAEAIADART